MLPGPIAGTRIINSNATCNNLNGSRTKKLMAKSRVLLITISFFIGLGMLVRGIFATLPTLVSQFHLVPRITDAVAVVGATIVIAALTRWARVSHAAVGICLAILIAMLSGALWPLLICGLFATASYAFGLS